MSSTGIENVSMKITMKRVTPKCVRMRNIQHQKKSIGQLTLADIIHLVPKGIDYSKVKLVTSWPRMMDWIDYKYIYSVPVDKAAKKAEYNKAMKSFEIAEAKYNKEMVKYEAYCKQVEIDTLEKRLASLKND